MANTMLRMLSELVPAGSRVPHHRQLPQREVDEIVEALASQHNIRHRHEWSTLPRLLGMLGSEDFPGGLCEGAINKDLCCPILARHIAENVELYVAFHIFQDIVEMRATDLGCIVGLVKRHACVWHGFYVIDKDLGLGWELHEDDSIERLALNSA